MKPCPVASAVENGEVYVVMAQTLQGGGRTELMVYRMSTGEHVHQHTICTRYVALPGGLLWEHCGRRLLRDYLSRDPKEVPKEQLRAYDAVYERSKP